MIENFSDFVMFGVTFQYKQIWLSNSAVKMLQCAVICSQGCKRDVAVQDRDFWFWVRDRDRDWDVQNQIISFILFY